MRNTQKELSKALTSSGDGAALVPYDLEPILNQELLVLQPLTELIDIVDAKGKTHEYTLRSSHPQGWFEGETTPANAKNGAYLRKTVQLKIQRIWGSVTGFAQAVDEAFIDALATELEGSLEGMSNTLEFGLLWGASDDIGFTGDAYQYSGVLPRIFKLAPDNVISAAGSKVSLDHLDQAIAAITKYRGTGSDPKLWIMGLRMRQVVDGLQTRVQIPLTSTVLQDGKITMANYSGAPILESDFVVPAATSTSPTLSASIAAGGALPDGSYTYRIASVTMYGEQVASATTSACVAATTNKKAELTWTADANALSYMIFRKLGTGEWALLDIIAALTYDANGTVNGAVATYTDDGSKAVIAKVKPLETGEQNIVLINRNPNRGVAFLGKVDDMGRPVANLFSFVELARVKDTYDYMVKGYLAVRMKYPNVSAAVIRNVKIA